jgi:leucyl/phenylalanyl-tRNA--protein transferase
MTTVEEFPEVKYANEDGLLALGGDLTAERLITAYKKGIFPWYNPGEPILWWSPDPRCVLFPKRYIAKRSLLKSIRKQQFQFSYDQDFETVIQKCAAPRARESGTWITKDMMDAYINLYHLGHAHSIETWKEGELVGGLYGIALGTMFFGESMFSQVNDASKAALNYLIENLIRWDYQLIDCQITSPHLLSLGATEIPRTDFVKQLECATSHPQNPCSWE